MVWKGQGIEAAQSKSLELINEIREKKLWQVLMLPQQGKYDMERLKTFERLWGKDDLMMIESTKAPTIKQIQELEACKELMCSQAYMNTRMIQGKKELSQVPNHLNIAMHGEERCNCKNVYVHEPLMGMEFVPCEDSDDFADLSHLGIIKFSKRFQETYPPDWKYTYNYRDYWVMLEVIHEFLFKYELYKAWHRHKELAWHTSLIHWKDGSGNSIYLTNEENDKIRGY